MRGSTVARLVRIFQESLLAFRPDIVTLSVYYNDSVYLTQVDEEAFDRQLGTEGVATLKRKVADAVRDGDQLRALGYIR